MRAPPSKLGAALISASALPCYPPAGWCGCYPAAMRAPPSKLGAARISASALPCYPPAGGCGWYLAAMRAPPSQLGAALIAASCLLCRPAVCEQDKCFAAGGLSRHGWPVLLRKCLHKAVAAARGRALSTHPPTPSVRAVSALPSKLGAAATPLPPIYYAC